MHKRFFGKGAEIDIERPCKMIAALPNHFNNLLDRLS